MRGDRRRAPFSFASALRGFGADERGATAIEYSLIVALVFLAILAAVRNVATSTNDMYSDITSTLSAPPP